jgi:AcrR family transcriptional regulator
VIEEEAPRRRIGGRSAAVLAAVRTAVEELMAERGSDRITIPLVAERSGVNPTSIYRRWGDVSTLINDVATFHLDPNRPLPDSGNFRDDLSVWARELAVHLARPESAALLRAGAARAGDENNDCSLKRRHEAELLVERATAAGQTTISADQVINHVVAPITYRAIFTPETLDATIVEQLIAGIDWPDAPYSPTNR